MQNFHSPNGRANSVFIDLSGLDAFLAKCEIDDAANDLWDNGYSLARFDRELSGLTLTANQRAHMHKVRDALEAIVDEDRREHGDD